MILPFVWWHSNLDHRTHAFSTNHAMDAERTCYEAACTLSMPTDAVMRWRKGVPCTACLLTIGSALPRPGPARSRHGLHEQRPSPHEQTATVEA